MITVPAMPHGVPGSSTSYSGGKILVIKAVVTMEAKGPPLQLARGGCHQTRAWQMFLLACVQGKPKFCEAANIIYKALLRKKDRK